MKRRLDTDEIEWNTGRKRACIAEWKLNKVIWGMIGQDYDNLTVEDLKDDEKAVVAEVISEVTTVKEWMVAHPQAAANEPRPPQEVGLGRNIYQRGYSIRVRAERISTQHAQGLPPEERVQSNLLKMQVPGGVADILGSSNIAYQGGEPAEMEEEPEAMDDLELEQLIAAGDQGTTADQAILEQHGDAGDDDGADEAIDEGDELSAHSQEEAMSLYPVHYLGRREVGGQSMWVIGIREQNDLALAEIKALRAEVVQLKSENADLSEKLTEYEMIKETMEVRGVTNEGLLDLMTEVEEGKSVLNEGKKINQDQIDLYKLLKAGMRRIEERIAPEYQEIKMSANKKLEALQPERRNRYVNGVANSIEGLTEEIMRKRAMRKRWKKTTKLNIGPPYLLLAIALCSSGQTGVTERSARRLFVAMTSLIMALQDRGLAKGANASQGWGYSIVVSEIFRKFFERDGEFTQSVNRS